MKTSRRSSKTAKIIPLPETGFPRINGAAKSPVTLCPPRELTPPPAAELRTASIGLTVVQARIDVGLGNVLFIRGQGGGLSWDKGQPLTCIEASRWVWQKEQVAEKLLFKLLVNDTCWAQGENLETEPGQTVSLEPAF